ncbi:MAG: hypothetical protein H6722_19805 [Sandaracinus sp.]|nr:hypothetical protein [Sandaracinus sp.]
MLGQRAEIRALQPGREQLRRRDLRGAAQHLGLAAQGLGRGEPRLRGFLLALAANQRVTERDQRGPTDARRDRAPCVKLRRFDVTTPERQAREPDPRLRGPARERTFEQVWATSAAPSSTNTRPTRSAVGGGSSSGAIVAATERAAPTNPAAPSASTSNARRSGVGALAKAFRSSRAARSGRPPCHSANAASVHASAKGSPPSVAKSRAASRAATADSVCRPSSPQVRAVHMASSPSSGRSLRASINASSVPSASPSPRRAWANPTNARGNARSRRMSR